MVPRFAIILLNGTTLVSRLQDETVRRILPTVSKLTPQLPPLYIFSQPPVIIFRISENAVLIMLTKLGEPSVNRILEIFNARFGAFFKTQYSDIPTTVGRLMNFGLVAIARQHGPEPFGWYSPEDLISEKELSEYAVTSMMVLMNERQGANSRVLNFHPFISENRLGLIYLFQIPDQQARGGSFDAAFLLTTDYEYRTNLYPKHLELEMIFSEFADEFVTGFSEKFGMKSNRPITGEDRDDFNFLMSNLFYRLNSVRMGIIPEHRLKHEMQNAIRKLDEVF